MSGLTEKIKTTLTVAFNNAAERKLVNGRELAYGVPGMYYLGLPLEDFTQPPVDFEKRHGMTGLSCQYFLPPDLLPRELQEYAMITREDARREERLREVWGHLKRGNPDTLGKLSFNEDDAGQLYHAILGAASAFLPDDIQAWLNGNNKITIKNDPQAEKLLNKIEVCIGWVTWAPCMSTLRSIERQLDEKRASVHKQLPPQATRRIGPHPQPPSKKKPLP